MNTVPRFNTFVLLLFVTLAVVSCERDVPPPPEYYVELAEEHGYDPPRLVQDYEPVHEEDTEDRVCYLVGISEKCLVQKGEVGPFSSFGDGSGCLGLEGNSWCPKSWLKLEFELQYSQPDAIPQGMVERAREHGLEAPELVVVPGQTGRCFRFGPEDDIGRWCWYEKVARGMTSGISPCIRGNAGTFWCRVSEMLPEPDDSWNWSWWEE